MSAPDDCAENTDALKLVREGTAQDGRSPKALDPGYAPVNERGVPENIVFGRGYAALLKYFNQDDTPAGEWSPFFSSDVSVQLGVPAIEDVGAYSRSLQEWFAYLNELENQNRDAELKRRFGYLYASVGSLAQQLDSLKDSLPDNVALKGKLQNLIQTQLAPALQRLISYYKGGNGTPSGVIADAAPPIQILRHPAVSFDTVLSVGLSKDWSDKAAWAAYLAGIAPNSSVYGDGGDVFSRINHCSTHTLFKSVFDQFFKVFAGVVREAKFALDHTLNNDNTHKPHYALYLSFLRLLEYARTFGNDLTQRHLNFYYRSVLGLKEKGSEPGHAHLLVQLAKQVTSREFKAGETFRAGKDDLGKDAFYASEKDFVANQAKVAARRNLYRHNDEKVNGSSLQEGRLFASPLPDSDDGQGAPLTSPDGSWHPFFNKIYTDGALTEVRMPEAEVGFAIASHYLLMAGGDRIIVASLTVSGYSGKKVHLADRVVCSLTTEKGWLEVKPTYFVPVTTDTIWLAIDIGGDAPPIVPYSAKVHGYNFQTQLPMLLVRLKQDDTQPYAYPTFQHIAVSKIQLGVWVDGLKTLAASNDFGPLDTSKPFQPFGASPITGSSFVVGSREIFQKHLIGLWIKLKWPNVPAGYPTDSVPNVALDVLSASEWVPITENSGSVTNETYSFSGDVDKTVLDEPDFTPNALFNTQSRSGYVRLRVTEDFGQDKYQTALLTWLRNPTASTFNSKPPAGPVASSLSATYCALTTLALDTADEGQYGKRKGQFFHLAPFGTAEQHPYLQQGEKIFLFPQFEFERNGERLASEAELYIGISGLQPPQNLSLLFQVADGTANPLVAKPHPHIDWSYLRKNQWVGFQANDVQDATDELLDSGIVTLPIPREATDDNTLLDSGLYWIRAAVHDKSDAVCRLQLLAAQALEAVFAARGNSPTFSAQPLPAGTISKLESPDAAVKSITQPFPSFGGRGAEQSQAFYTRVSERLRHKNRAIDLWDYERLILEAFPQIYKARCLNHTCYEPSESGAGIYRELAPGHVTVITIPNLRLRSQRDPLKPYTSLGLLDDIKTLLEARTSCFAQLHVKNPQFEEVRARFSVRLYDGFDEAYCTKLLKQAITRFLSPWAFADEGAPTFSGRVYKSMLVNFVEDQPYVDYVTDFQLFQDIGSTPGTVDLDEVEGSRAVSVLVSAPASKHQIAVIRSEQIDAPGESCSCP